MSNTFNFTPILYKKQLIYLSEHLDKNKKSGNKEMFGTEELR